MALYKWTYSFIHTDFADTGPLCLTVRLLVFAVLLLRCMLLNAQNPSNTFHRSFPIDRDVANLLQTCYRGNWCNGFWLLMVVRCKQLVSVHHALFYCVNFCAPCTVACIFLCTMYCIVYISAHRVVAFTPAVGVDSDVDSRTDAAILR